MNYLRKSKKPYFPQEQFVMLPLALQDGPDTRLTGIVKLPAPHPLPVATWEFPRAFRIFAEQHLDPKKRNICRLLIWTHQLARTLDLIGLRDLVDHYGWTIDFVIDMDPPGICSISKGRMRVTFWDVRNWLNMTIGELIEKMPEEDRLFLDNWKPTDKCMQSEYAAFLAISYAVHKIRNVCMGNKWGPVRATCAAQSLAVYTNCYPLVNGPCGWEGEREWSPTYGSEDKVYPLVHRDELTLDTERKALFGGVVSSFRPNEVHEDVDVWDCNSLYGFLGESKLFPVKYLGMVNDPGRIRKSLSDSSCTGFCYVGIKSPSYPFPVTIGDRNRYVRGKYWTYLAWPELQVAERMGVIDEYGGAIIYAAERLLGRFSGKLLALKKAYTDLDDAMSLSIVKRVLNGLWGKFGQRNDIWRRLKDECAMVPWSMWAGLDADTRQVILYRAFGNDVWERRGTYYPQHASPIISAVMCSHARVYMNEVIQKIRPENVLYSATDSLHLTKLGSNDICLSGFVDESKPGMFSIREELSNVKYARPGWYTSDSKSVHAGVPVTASLNERGNVCFSKSEGLRTLLTTPTLTHLRSKDVELTPPMATRRKSRPPRTFAELWETYIQRKRTDRPVTE